MNSAHRYLFSLFAYKKNYIRVYTMSEIYKVLEKYIFYTMFCSNYLLKIQI